MQLLLEESKNSPRAQSLHEDALVVTAVRARANKSLIALFVMPPPFLMSLLGVVCSVTRWEKEFFVKLPDSIQS